MSETLVTVENVSKKFCRSLKKSLWYGVQDIASALNPFGAQRSEIGDQRSEIGGQRSEIGGQRSEGLDGMRLPALRSDEFWAVQNVSFELKRGECLGLIGHNGAGKSTLLKVLNGLIPPDTGRITMRGRVCALIELNAGFNPILTGRENIFNQAALLGFSKEETLAKFDSIVDFADIGDFLDMPVQNYSSGMQVRLGFAIAAQMEPDVLIIDEVLAVGDIGFRYKCLARISEILRNSACIFVSHSMPQVAKICTAAIHLEHGKAKLASSNLKKAIQSYYNGFEDNSRAEFGSGSVRCIHASILDPEGNPVPPSEAVIPHGGDLCVEAVCRFEAGCVEATIQFVIWNQEMLPVVDVLGGGIRRFPIKPQPDGSCRLRAKIPKLQLNEGKFYCSVVLLSSDGSIVFNRLDNAFFFQMDSNSSSAAIITIEADWLEIY